MKRLATALAAAATLSLMIAPAFAAAAAPAKPDLDGLLKQVLHGKPGWWAAELPAPPALGKTPTLKDFPLLWPLPHKAK